MKLYYNYKYDALVLIAKYGNFCTCIYHDLSDDEIAIDVPIFNPEDWHFTYIGRL